jgi:PAS domain S-box-containing protein
MTREEMELAIGRVVLERGPNLVAVADASGRIRYVNGRFTEITGWTEEEVLGRELDELSRGDTTEAWRSLREGREWRGELEARRKSGGSYWEFASITPVRSAEGKVALYLKVSEDVTDRKRVEADLLSARDEAERAQRPGASFWPT